MIDLSKPALQQALSKDRLFLPSRRGGLLVLIGIWFGWMEGVAAITLLTRGAPGKPWFLGASLILAVAFLDVLFGWKTYWIIDLKARRYTWSRGIFPLITHRTGPLDDFEAVRLERQDFGSSGRSTTPHFIPALRLRPKVGPEPPPIIVLKAHDRHLMEDLLQLAQKISLEGGLAFEDLTEGAPQKASLSAGRVMLAFGIITFAWFAGLIWLGQTDMVRGDSFPVSIGRPVVINARLHDCQVRSFTLSAGTPTQVWVSSGEHGQTLAPSTPYTVTLDLIGTRPGLTAPSLVVGLAKVGTDVSQTVNSAAIKPGETTQVTLTLSIVGSPPEKLFVREAD